VNGKGHFNVPMGRYKHPRILRADVLMAASRALQGVHIEVSDFRDMTKIAEAEDFFYFDPPYDPLSKTSNFTGYTAGHFSEEDQADLARVYDALTRKGCFCMLSNSCTPLVRKLYSEYRIETVRAKRAVNSKGNRRGEIEEVVVLNY